MNYGFNNEYELVNCLNQKKINELSSYLQYFVKTIFKEIDEESIIYSNLCDRTSKPDIYIKINNDIKFISVKSGRSNSIHFEKINEFSNFLKSLNISDATIETIRLFHYGDGTLDGTGEKRMLFEELYPLMYRKIIKANDELNQPNIVKAFLDRALFNGVDSKYLKVDYVYHGNTNYGVFCSKEQITSFIMRKNYSHIRTLHIGPMTLQPFLRDVHNISKNKYKREYLQVKWHYFLSDLETINKYY